MKEVIKKADVLIEALPYIKKFHDKIVVIKYGGSALDQPEIRRRILEDIIFMNYVGMRPVLVHGGGPAINKRMREAGKKVKFVEGLRVTDKETMAIVEETLGKLNAQIGREIESLGAKVKGFAEKETVIKAKKHPQAKPASFIGEVEGIDTAPLKKALREKAIPVISPVGVGKKQTRYNVNADEAAAAVAGSLKAEKLVLLTNVRGIMAEAGNVDSLISTLIEKQAHDLIKRKVVQEGMIPKVKACIAALDAGVKKTHIIDAMLPHSLLLEIFTDRGIGTEIVK